MPIGSPQKMPFSLPRLLAGDWLLLIVGVLVVIGLFLALWQTPDATRVLIRLNGKTYGVYSLQQDKIITISGAQGLSRIAIHQGQVRFLQSPCANQYCVHQGWLKRAGQVAICLPNHISIELLSPKPAYDSLNY